MDRIPQKNTNNASDYGNPENDPLQSSHYNQRVSDRSSETNYAIKLLLIALWDLATDIVIYRDIDPDYLITKYLVIASVRMQFERHKPFVDCVDRDYKWLIDLLLVRR